MPIPRRLLLALLAPLLATSCIATRKLADPTVLIHTSGGTELGVSTEYGVVFLGRTARSGDVEITAWFGDGPDIEPSAIEPIGGGLYTAETEIRLPSVPLDFETPAPGDSLLLIARDSDGRRWQEWVRVVSNPRVRGLLVSPPQEHALTPAGTGAGLFKLPEGDRASMRLVGLVSGRLVLETAEGREEYLTVLGPEVLWRLAAHRRDWVRGARLPYREDIR